MGMTKRETGMTEQTDGSDKSDPYISEIDRRPVPRENGDTCPTDGMGFMNQTPTFYTGLIIEFIFCKMVDFTRWTFC